MKKIKRTLSLTVLILFLSTFNLAYPEEGGSPPEAGSMARGNDNVTADQTDAEETTEENITYVRPGNVTVNFKDADIRAVLNYLSEVGGVDIVPAPDVSGPVTLKLTDKPWKTALDIIIKNYGYAYEQDGDIIRVVTLSSLKLEELSTEVIALNYAAAEEAQDAVKDMLTARGKLTYDPRTNSLVVTDLATNIYKIRQVIQNLDKKTPQIMIEAKIIETTLTKTERLGIDWNMVIAAAGAARPITFPFDSFSGDWGVASEFIEKFIPVGTTGSTDVEYQGGSGATIVSEPGVFPTGAGIVADAATRAFPFVGPGAFTFGTLDFSQFSLVLEYLKARVNTDIISSPRITTLNNKEAKMFVGEVYNYISEIERRENTGGGERWEYTISKEEIGVRLLVTPHVNKNGDIEVKVKPEIKDVVGFQQITEYFSLPIFTTREAETQIMVKDNETIFIGGLIKENVKKYDKKVPILGDILGNIPLLGNAFKYKGETKEKTELVFFLTVHLVKNVRGLTEDVAKNVEEVRIPLDITQNSGPAVAGGALGASPYKKEKKAFLDFRSKKNAAKKER
ncbi:MAG: secretin and TonB N-terminal domain-containing protein [Candidatus Omnitrophica bacterium]|nr:secretin and TonB N-terminal domain-containing protein [Candidatus Omnitrophota bacterium]